MSVLAQKLEKADGPDRTLDVLIVETLVPATCGRMAETRSATSSASAALAILEIALPGWKLNLSIGWENQCRARLESPDYRDDLYEAGGETRHEVLYGTDVVAIARTVPIAIIKAIVDALIATARDET
jgi:hypothetical protein